MKLQKQLSRKYGDKEYVKWVVVIPQKIVDKMELNENVDVVLKTEGRDRLIMKFMR